jgi:cellobiose-specific phosphotransferase system component IIB
LYRLYNPVTCHFNYILTFLLPPGVFFQVFIKRKRLNAVYLGMKSLIKLMMVVCIAGTSASIFAQKHTPLPHGMVFGNAPSNINQMPANRLETFMGKRTRTSVVIYGKVIKVTKEQGGWFEMDAGNGKVIAAHFRDYNIKIPVDLAGRQVIIDGVAEKQFIADDLQHMAGDTVQGKKQHMVKTNPKE